MSVIEVADGLQPGGAVILSERHPYPLAPMFEGQSEFRQVVRSGLYFNRVVVLHETG